MYTNVEESTRWRTKKHFINRLVAKYWNGLKNLKAKMCISSLEQVNVYVFHVGKLTRTSPQRYILNRSFVLDRDLTPVAL